MRLRAVGAFFAFLVVEQLVEGGAGWVAFVKLKLLEQKWQPSSFAGIEGITIAGVIAGSLVAALIQKKRLSDYGFAPGGAARQLAAGSAWGLGAVALLVAAIAALGGFTVTGLALKGSAIATYTIGWLLVMFLLGLAEEGLFRATGMFTLGDAIGIWPAAIVTTLIFVALHYFAKPNETVADALSVGLLGFFMAYTVIRTGSIWWAVGFHALFDYAALFIVGAPNTGNNGGQSLDTKLLAGNFHGPTWLTGGRTGIEASWLIFPVIALLFLGFAFSHRRESSSDHPRVVA